MEDIDGMSGRSTSVCVCVCGGGGGGGGAIGFSDACDNSGMLASYNMTSLCLTYDWSISAHVCSLRLKTCIVFIHVNHVDLP